MQFLGNVIQHVGWTSTYTSIMIKIQIYLKTASRHYNFFLHTSKGKKVKKCIQCSQRIIIILHHSWKWINNKLMWKNFGKILSRWLSFLPKEAYLLHQHGLLCNTNLLRVVSCCIFCFFMSECTIHKHTFFEINYNHSSHAILY